MDCSQLSTESLVLRSLRQQLAKELGPDIGVVCRDVDGDPQNLWPVERDAVLKAIPRRQREFAAGRTAAREAMVQIGFSPEAIPSAPDRSPVWPERLMGSITHNDRVCVAIVGRRDTVLAMGIDIEEDLGMDPALWAMICTPKELATLSSLPKSEQGRSVTRYFCAKEAFYKWQYPQTQRVLDFCDVDVKFGPNYTGFCVLSSMSGNAPLPSCGTEGRLLVWKGLVVAWLIKPHTPQTSCLSGS